MRTELMSQVLDVIDKIRDNESEFLNDNGYFDKCYIMERFGLTKEQYSFIIRVLDREAV